MAQPFCRSTGKTRAHQSVVQPAELCGGADPPHEKGAKRPCTPPYFCIFLRLPLFFFSVFLLCFAHVFFRMATPVEVEGEDHLRRLVQQHDTVIVSCFPSGKDVDSEQDLHQELTSNVTSTVLRRTSLNTVRAAGLLLPDDQEDDEKLHQEVRWFFFRGGEMVRAVPARVKCLYSSSHQLLRVPPRFKFNESIVPSQRSVGRMPTIITLSQGIHKEHLGCLRNFNDRPFSCVERAWEILYTHGVD